jgi:CheY-like chemotaxis protein
MPLKDRTILVVEDNPLIALDIAMMLEDEGALVLGPCASVDEALALIDENAGKRQIHAAVLDFDLRIGTSVRVAHLLQEMAIPFIFYTGMDPAKASALKRLDAPVIPKPSPSAFLIASLVAQLQN